MSNTHQIMVADPMPTVRFGIKTLLRNNFKCHVYEAGDEMELLQALNNQEFNLVIFSIHLPGMCQTASMTRMRELQPDTKLVILSSRGDRSDMILKFRHGVHGYITKDACITDVVAVARRVLDGRIMVTHLQMEDDIRDMADSSQCNGDLLSDREIEVLQLICDGLRSRDIGDKLSLSTKTVGRHRDNLIEKTGCKNKIELVKYAIKNGLVILVNIFIWVSLNFDDLQDVGEMVA